MARLKPVEFEDMNDEQRKVARTMISGPRGHAGGLMGLWLHNPALAERVQAVGEFLRFKGILPGHITELCILLVAREWNCLHEWYMHEPLALKKGLEGHVIESIRHKQVPDLPGEAEMSVYSYVSSMLQKHEVCDEDYASVIRHFGSAAIIEIAGIVGHYIIGAATLNAVEYSLPEGYPKPF
jgi:4-carboxymuconolactone decarboxylase